MQMAMSYIKGKGQISEREISELLGVKRHAHTSLGIDFCKLKQFSIPL